MQAEGEVFPGKKVSFGDNHSVNEAWYVLGEHF